MHGGQGIGDIGAQHLALLGIINAQHGHKTVRLIHHRSVLITRFFADDEITVPAVVGGDGGAAGVAHGFADAAAQAVVAVAAVASLRMARSWAVQR